MSLDSLPPTPGPWIYGDVTIERVLDLEVKLSPFPLLPELTPEILDRHRDWLGPELMDPHGDKLIGSFHSFIIRAPDSITVVDTCCGNDKQRPNRPHYHQQANPYLERLVASGIRPEDVDYVLCTHLHGDHVGWNTRLQEGRWVPTFPNARYLVSRLEWEYWQNEARREAYNPDDFYDDSIRPVYEAGQLELIDESFRIAENITVELTPGHTPGHLCVRISDGKEEAVMSGDLMHCVLQVAEPQLNSCFCEAAEEARATRKTFLKRALKNNTLVMPAHFPAPSAGRVVTTDDGEYRFQFESSYDTNHKKD